MNNVISGLSFEHFFGNHRLVDLPEYVSGCEFFVTIVNKKSLLNALKFNWFPLKLVSNHGENFRKGLPSHHLVKESR